MMRDMGLTKNYHENAVATGQLLRDAAQNLILENAHFMATDAEPRVARFGIVIPLDGFSRRAPPTYVNSNTKYIVL